VRTYAVAVVLSALFGLAAYADHGADQVMIDSPGGIQVGTDDPVMLGVPALVVSYREAGVEQCSITADLRVVGPHRTRCVEHLETVARLARASWRVNRRTR
jgi:hypothetical protein